MTGFIGIIAGVLTSVSVLPQLIKMLRERNSTEISLSMLVVLVIGLSMWVLYGYLKDDWPIVITNTFAVLVNTCVIILRVQHGRQRLQAE